MTHILGRVTAWQKQKILLLPVLAFGGCTSAPTIPLFGAYFPGWLLCATVGVGGAIVIRTLSIISGFDTILAFRLFTYVAAGALVGLGLWSLIFGP